MSSLDNTGYTSAKYSSAFAGEFVPRHLPGSDSWMLERRVYETPFVDAIGTYPLLCCADWGQLGRDLAQLKHPWVSLTAVTDPLGQYTPADLGNAFPDLVRPFKEHFVFDLSMEPGTAVSKHHRYYARKALSHCVVDICRNPAEHKDTWVALYSNLITRHHMTGLQAFSPQALSLQIDVPGLIMFIAANGDKVLGIHLWYRMNGNYYSHLQASSEEGYELNVAYALYWTALTEFKRDGSFAVLGSSSGVDGSSTDGLTFFKKGWATGTRTAFLCGRIFDKEAYRNLCEQVKGPSNGFFPAYRQQI